MDTIPGITVQDVGRTSTRSLLANAIINCVQFIKGFTDIIVHEDERIRLETAAGMRYMPDDLAESNRVFKEADFRHFFSFLFGSETQFRSGTYWDNVIAPKLQRKEAHNAAAPMQGGDIHLRFSLYLHTRGKLGLRIRIAHFPMEMKNVGLSKSINERITQDPRGLLIITGPTASGKTSTAYSILQWMNANRSGSIITIEDPIEFPLKNEKCDITQREVGIDVTNFSVGLLDAMRMSPRAMLCGEVREKEAAEFAIQGGESGSLMIVTTHGRSITGALRKILSFSGDQNGALREMLAGSLIGVIRQELMPRADRKGYAMVSETLHPTENVRTLLQKGDWMKLDHLTQQSAMITDDFIPMTNSLQALLANRTLVREDVPYQIKLND